MKVLAMFALAAGAAFAAGDAAAGKALYEKKCQGCHNTKKVDVAKLAAKSEADIKAALTAVSEGKVKGHPKAALSAADMDNITAFLKSK